MSVFIVLLRGVNVGGHHKLPMAQLRELITSLGAGAVETYIQSGNAVIDLPQSRAKAFPKKLRALIERDFGFAPLIQMFDTATYQKILGNNPYAGDNADPSKLHVMFLEQKAEPKQLAEVQELVTGEEQLSAKGHAIYLSAPAGIGRSKAAEKLNRVFAHGTMRNWRSCLKLEEMSASIG